MEIRKKNFVTIMDKSYHSPASDGVLIAPFVRHIFKFDKNIRKILQIDCDKFVEKLSNCNWKNYIPRFKFSSILNAPNKYFGQKKTFKIYLHKELCIQCKKCLNNCPHKTIVLDERGYPKVNADKCENCYRCIHHCPKKALSLSKRQPIKTVITYSNLNE